MSLSGEVLKRLDGKDLRERCKQLEKIVESQEKKIQSLKNQGFSFPKSRPKKSATADFLRVIIGDTHGCFVDKDSFAAVLRDLEILKPAQIILLGDHLDAAGWLSKHHPFKTVQEARYTFEEDQQATNVQLDEIQKRCPKAEIHYLEGNHEERLEAFCIEATAGCPADAKYLSTLFSPSSILSLEKRRITYYRRTVAHHDMRVNGVINLGDKCFFTHGTFHSKDAARAHVRALKRCVVFGHVHRRLQAGEADVYNEIDAWCPGCLCRMEPMWLHGKPSEWAHGYGIQTVNRSTGRFFHINVPILDGTTDISTIVK